MRAELLQWVEQYPRGGTAAMPPFNGSPLGDLVKNAIPNAIRAAVQETAGMKIKGSIGSGGWTDTPWVAVLDRAITETVQEEYYVVYLLSRDGKRLYLTLAQGCTTLQKEAGIPGAETQLRHRAGVMISRARSSHPALGPLKIELRSRSWRGRLYEAGVVAGLQYSTGAMPHEGALIEDLRAILALYRAVRDAGGWQAEDEIIAEAEEACGSVTLQQAKRYRYHRSIERQASHSRAVKKVLGTRCMACDVDPAERYGEFGRGMVDAHHLTPLATLNEGGSVSFDAAEDFAVLCPNCHRAIHRLPDVADLAGLRELIAVAR